MKKDDFNYLSQELDLVKEKGLYPYEYMSNFGKIKEKLPSKEMFYNRSLNR